MCKQIFSSVVILLVLVSCGKNSARPERVPQVLSQAKIAEINTQLDYFEEDGAKYVEKACTVGGKIGTACEAAKGSCKKERDCTASTLTYDEFSEASIEGLAEEHAKRMVREGFVDAKNMESSRRVARAILNAQKK